MDATRREFEADQMRLPGGREIDVWRWRPIALLIWSVVALTAAGGYEAVGVIGRGAPARPPAAVGEEVPTSFGALSVIGVERLSAHAHGPVRALPPGTFQLQLTVALRNVLPRAVDPAPDSLRVAGLAPVRSTLPRTLRPGASATGRVSFFVPTRSDGLGLTYPDPESGEPLAVDLGRGGHPHAGSSR